MNDDENGGDAVVGFENSLHFVNAAVAEPVLVFVLNCPRSNQF